MLKAQEWARRPKPEVDAKPPVDVDDYAEIVARVRLMIDVMHLALQTDSTRFITFALTLPILAAGGGFRHSQHLSFDPKKHPPLCNLYVQFSNRLGADVDAFGSSRGTIPGFDLA